MTEEELARGLRAERYFADEGLLTAVHLALTLGRPLLLEGEPGVGKTEIAAVLARVLGRELVRLQCYEGLDAGQALYEWDYPKQLLHLRAAESGQLGDVYAPDFLLERPLLRSLRVERGAVLLVDEVDRADSEFEAFLLEYLGDFQITIPELGTITAAVPTVWLGLLQHLEATGAALPHLKKGASIVNTTSVTAYRGSPDLLDYSATKGAIVAFTRSLAQKLVKDGIRVNGVAPGPIWTPLIPATFPEDKVKSFGANTPMQRPGQPNEVASCFLFLACEDASYITGSVLHPNGGDPTES